ncbi:MAG: zinc-binding dehydrogenase [Henriciella sp.]|nr:zinc-binding dehydrogenase [Henriciella sp.]
MLAALLDQSGFRVEERNAPVPGPGEVLVKTLACGICGGDQHTFSVRDRLKDNEILLGHEGTGNVVAVGEGVTAFQVGDLVTSLRGAFAEYFITPEAETMKVPANVDPRHALGEPVACCVHASWRFGTKPGDTVAVVGCGFMGLICMQLAKLQGAGRIVAIDPVDYRRDVALRLGADEAMSPDNVPNYDPDEGLFDIVIEATGVPSALELSTDLVKQHGIVSLIGYHESQNGQRSVNMQRWNFKAIDVINGHVRRDDEKFQAMVEGVNLIADGKLQTAPLVDQYQLEDISVAFDDIFGRQKELFKVVLVTDELSETTE